MSRYKYSATYLKSKTKHTLKIAHKEITIIIKFQWNKLQPGSLPIQEYIIICCELIGTYEGILNHQPTQKETTHTYCFDCEHNKPHNPE